MQKLFRRNAIDTKQKQFGVKDVLYGVGLVANLAMSKQVVSYAKVSPKTEDGLLLN
ncbi:UNKNOWN [Stylonychia lemnae]|uniref:Uncharacterized protein n=1 Tax=Stylonychia lemnae TaxID=5949 RepID=A0A078BAG3_STYLE|nr:UNKNOWN [Stylonychia lemnae]|eukprot:CDW90247.1 UNKNOWN [Stylonychia lemnae]